YYCGCFPLSVPPAPSLFPYTTLFRSGQGGFAVQRPCPVCRGKGKVPSQRCPTCNGNGEVTVQKRLVITVPPGTDDGTRLRHTGQGTKGKGDVVVVVQVEPDRFFRREGALDLVG